MEVHLRSSIVNNKLLPRIYDLCCLWPFLTSLSKSQRMCALLDDTTNYRYEITFAPMPLIDCLLCFFFFHPPQLKHPKKILPPLLSCYKMVEQTIPKTPSPLSGSISTPLRPEPNKQLKAITFFRAVESQLHRLLMSQALKDKAIAAAASDNLPADIPMVYFVCPECQMPVNIPCRGRTSCRTHCLLCCECPVPRT